MRQVAAWIVGCQYRHPGFGKRGEAVIKFAVVGQDGDGAGLNRAGGKGAAITAAALDGDEQMAGHNLS